jgi:hypothetical protein
MHMEATMEDLQDTSRIMKAPFGPPAAEPDRHMDQRTLNIRAVGFVAKPGSIHDLTAVANGPLMELLRQAPGFVNAIVLHAHKEMRNITVLTLWETETHAMRTCWEEFRAVRKLTSPLVDVCTKVQTLQGMLAEPNDRSTNRTH